MVLEDQDRKNSHMLQYKTTSAIIVAVPAFVPGANGAGRLPEEEDPEDLTSRAIGELA